MGLAGHVAHIKTLLKSHKLSVTKSEQKISFEGPRQRANDNNKTFLKDKCY